MGRFSAFDDHALTRLEFVEHGLADARAETEKLRGDLEARLVAIDTKLGLLARFGWIGLTIGGSMFVTIVGGVAVALLKGWLKVA